MAVRRLFTRDRIIFNIIGYMLLILVCIICILPFYLIIVGSFTDEGTIIREGFGLWIPKFSLGLQIMP